MVSVHSPCSLPGLHTSPISTWKTEQDLLRLLHHYLSANTQTCCQHYCFAVFDDLFNYTINYVSDSLQKASWQHYETPAGVAVKETINFSDEHIVPTPPSGPKNTSHEMPPPPPLPPGCGWKWTCTNCVPFTLNTLHVILNTIVNLLSQNSIWTSAYAYFTS